MESIADQSKKHTVAGGAGSWYHPLERKRPAPHFEKDDLSDESDFEHQS